MADMITPNFSKAEMSCRCVSYLDHMDEKFMKMLQQLRNEIGPLLNRNFDLRKSVYRISEGNLAMIEAARDAGASAKFTGSGGAIVGVYEGEEMFERLTTNLAPLGVKIFKPTIEPENP